MGASPSPIQGQDFPDLSDQPKPNVVPCSLMIAAREQNCNFESGEGSARAVARKGKSRTYWLLTVFWNRIYFYTIQHSSLTLQHLQWQAIARAHCKGRGRGSWGWTSQFFEFYFNIVRDAILAYICALSIGCKESIRPPTRQKITGQIPSDKQGLWKRRSNNNYFETFRSQRDRGPKVSQRVPGFVYSLNLILRKPWIKHTIIWAGVFWEQSCDSLFDIDKLFFFVRTCSKSLSSQLKKLCQKERTEEVSSCCSKQTQKKMTHF
jgi:hypothetical protein